RRRDADHHRAAGDGERYRADPDDAVRHGRGPGGSARHRHGRGHGIQFPEAGCAAGDAARLAPSPPGFGKTRETTMQKITTWLWFDGQAEEAMAYYTSIFKNSKPGRITRHDGGVLTCSFELEGREFTALNGGPQFKFTEAVSLYVDCADQAEVDYYWERLTADGGAESQCGWLKDKFGLSWQI